MRHDWIFDVLTDLRSYAQKNGLDAIAAETDHLIQTARRELADKTRSEQGNSDQDSSSENETPR